MRTHFSLLLITIFSLSGNAFASPSVNLSSSAPVTATNPLRNVTPESEEDKKKVVVFFRFDCAPSRDYHLPLLAWSKAIPKEIQVEFRPVFEDSKKISAGAFFTYWASQKLKIDTWDFVSSAYNFTLTEKRGDEYQDWLELLARFTTKSKIKGADVLNAYNLMLDNSAPLLSSQFHYKPTSTPSVVICGQWMITPDSTQGNQEMFFKLANGLLSKCVGSR